MDTDRRERAKSIRAARDWLAGAEDALAGKDDLAGDLKLMLARAELARIVANRRARLRRWAGWLLPPLAAAAAWAWLSWEPTAPPEETAIHAPLAVHSVAEERAEAPAPDTIAPVRHETAVSALQEVPAERTASSPQQISEPSVPAPPRESVSAAQNTISRMPDPDMQRLMQVGGKILRE